MATAQSKPGSERAQYGFSRTRKLRTVCFMRMAVLRQTLYNIVDLVLIIDSCSSATEQLLEERTELRLRLHIQFSLVRPWIEDVWCNCEVFGGRRSLFGKSGHPLDLCQCRFTCVRQPSLAKQANDISIYIIKGDPVSGSMARSLQVLSLLSRLCASSEIPTASIACCRFASRGINKAWMGQSHVHRDTVSKKASRYSDETCDEESELDDVEEKLQALVE